MIRSFFGLKENPFSIRRVKLLGQQQEIHDALKVHCQQGGLCLVLGIPGTGKSVIKDTLSDTTDKRQAPRSAALYIPIPIPSRFSAMLFKSISKVPPSDARNVSLKKRSISIAPENHLLPSSMTLISWK